MESLKQLDPSGVYDPDAKYDDLFKVLESLRETATPEEPRLEPSIESAGDESVGEPKLEPKMDKSAEVKQEDYLRQYQYRKQTAFGSVESDPAKGSKAEIMKRQLLAQPKVRIIVPRLPGEDPSIKATVNLNNYRLDFPKQAYIDMPQQIAELIMDSQGQTEAAIMRGQISGNKTKENALL
ncbi:hypothetical protein HY469_02235 [Candidatus Roizmanbacteria bacterium]|nr:hypothetical protein [Candidatus Roizmanbacteria bacterium]